MTERAITIEFDDQMLTTVADEYLATLWHVAQANPVDGFENRGPGEIAERVGREIIRRWLRDAPIEIYHQQGRHYYAHQLRKFAKYEPGDPEWDAGQWVPHTTDPDDAETPA